MSLSAAQIRFINKEAKGKTAKKIRDMIGFLYKDNIRKYIQKSNHPKSIKEILINMKRL